MEVKNWQAAREAERAHWTSTQRFSETPDADSEQLFATARESSGIDFSDEFMKDDSGSSSSSSQAGGRAFPGANQRPGLAHQGVQASHEQDRQQTDQQLSDLAASRNFFSTAAPSPPPPAPRHSDAPTFRPFGEYARRAGALRPQRTSAGRTADVQSAAATNVPAQSPPRRSTATSTLCPAFPTKMEAPTCS